ncbi:MAG TPA: hypothetical protein VK658_25260 [Chryseolinea sp.]|nr:hypothetical protein [Chryseolinea sp.]
MIRLRNCCLLLSGILLAACSDFNSHDAEMLLDNAHVYPLIIEVKMFCNSDKTVEDVIAKNLVKGGYVTAQREHTKQDVGKPLIYFTNLAQPFLLSTDDTLKSFDIQRVKVADEIFLRVRNVEISASGDKAVVDYATQITNHTPFIALYEQDIEGEQRRRTFFTRKDDNWTWDGKIIKMPR